MAEFSSFNGYTVKDATARNIAKGRNQAVAYSDYATMIETLNAMDNEQFRIGQNIYIGTVGVPDLWVYYVEPIQHNFSYVSDEETVELLKNNVTIQAGFYKLAMLEGQKVDLTTINERIEECFQSVSDGKELLASAITDKRVPTDAEATFAEMEANIRSIVLGSGDAVASDVRKGKTFTNDDGIEYTGTYDFAAETEGTAVAAQLTKGYTAWVNGVKITGTRPAKATSQSGSVGFSGWDDGDTMEKIVTFGTAFDSVPTVTIAKSSTGVNINKFDASVSNVTKTGFKITAKNNTGGGFGLTVSWTASS